MIDLSNKRVLVTGGTRGIGRATVDALLKAGARVAVNGRTRTAVDDILSSLKAGKNAVAAPGDLSNLEQCRAVVEMAVIALDGLDGLVNNAGIGGIYKSLGDTTPEDWDAMLNVNLRAVYFCTKYALPALRASNGNVVNVASILGLGGRGIGTSLYCTAKGGVVNLTRDLAIELAPNIRVNCVCPGAIDTDMLQGVGQTLGHGDVVAGYAKITENRPMKRVAKPAEIANLILYLSSDLASFTTGAIYVADGGVMAKAG